MLKQGEDVGFSSIGKTRQSATVTANNEGRVFRLDIPNGFVGFIYWMANNWFSNTYYRLSIDGEEIEDGKIDWQYAALNNPRQISPPYVAEKYIEVTGVNNSSESINFEWLIDGKIYREVD